MRLQDASEGCGWSVVGRVPRQSHGWVEVDIGSVGRVLHNVWDLDGEG